MNRIVLLVGVMIISSFETNARLTLSQAGWRPHVEEHCTEPWTRPGGKLGNGQQAASSIEEVGELAIAFHNETLDTLAEPCLDPRCLHNYIWTPARWNWLGFVLVLKNLETLRRDSDTVREDDVRELFRVRLAPLIDLWAQGVPMVGAGAVEWSSEQWAQGVPMVGAGAVERLLEQCAQDVTKYVNGLLVLRFLMELRDSDTCSTVEAPGPSVTGVGGVLPPATTAPASPATRDEASSASSSSSADTSTDPQSYDDYRSSVDQPATVSTTGDESSSASSSPSAEVSTDTMPLAIAPAVDEIASWVPPTHEERTLDDLVMVDDPRNTGWRLLIALGQARPGVYSQTPLHIKWLETLWNLRYYIPSYDECEREELFAGRFVCPETQALWLKMQDAYECALCQDNVDKRPAARFVPLLLAAQQILAADLSKTTSILEFVKSVMLYWSSPEAVPDPREERERRERERRQAVDQNGKDIAALLWDKLCRIMSQFDILDCLQHLFVDVSSDIKDRAEAAAGAAAIKDILKELKNSLLAAEKQYHLRSFTPDKDIQIGVDLGLAIDRFSQIPAKIKKMITDLELSADSPPSKDLMALATDVDSMVPNLRDALEKYQADEHRLVFGPTPAREPVPVTRGLLDPLTVAKLKHYFTSDIADFWIRFDEGGAGTAGGAGMAGSDTDAGAGAGSVAGVS